ncbi:MFS transporter [Rhodococcus rhodochrous]|uniref:MFS transporter n=1 Tax=Rhodococcus rhodochrous TaxID=1829 RepID=UPI000D05435C|nr:MFS transporter [Rhodococcus rhodochrous]AYA24817.1 MFS transporter [Rhodococcus rhodochrous]
MRKWFDGTNRAVQFPEVPESSMTTRTDTPAAPAAETDTGTPLALSALLAGTLVGTLSNNIINVPLPQILSDFDASLEDGALLAVGFLLTFSAAMPLAGYIGDRYGRRRVYCGALLGTAICAAGAATAPTLEILVVWRALGGVAAAAFAPAVMGLIAWLFGAHRRARAVGAWATVNGLGQAIGPTLGGFVAEHWGWRWVFVPMIPIALIGLAGTLRWIPIFPGRRMTLDVPGAIALTLGSAGVVLGLSMFGQAGVPTSVAGIALAVSIVVLVGFVVHCLRADVPFVDVRLLVESRFARSAAAAFAQMFCLGAALLAVPLRLHATGASTATGGAILFALPAVMAVLAPVVGRTVDRVGARRILRAGLVVLLVGQIALAVVLSADEPRLWLVATVLAITGAGIAAVQTPAAAGSTRSPAGERGTGLGVFNLIRFGGSAVGAAWVTVALGSWTVGPLFAVCAVVVCAGFAASFLGADPEDHAPTGSESTALSGS